MGNFYTNYTLKGPTQQAVAAALAGRIALVTPEQNGSLVVFDEASDDQNHEEIVGLALRLSAELNCPLLAVLNHDDDILWYQLYVNGRLCDEYDSSPGYFDSDAEPSAPSGGDAEQLCAVFGSGDFAVVETVLRKSSFDEDGYVFAFQRHEALVRALGLPEFAVGTAYASFESDELPEGLSKRDLVRVSSS